MKKNKKKIILLIVVLMLTAGVIKTLFFRNKTVTETENNNSEPSFKTVRTVETEMSSPKSVEYAGQKSITLEKKIAVYKISNQNISDVLIKKIAESFGFKGEAAVNEERFVIYDNQEDNTRLDISKRTGTVKFSKNLLLNPMIKPVRTASFEEIEEKLTGIMIKIFGLGQEIKIKVERVGYEELAGPRFAASTKEKGNIVKMVANYEINGLPIFSVNGFPVIARFVTDGNLLNLTVDLPFGNVIRQGELSVKDEDELRVIPAEEYKIVDVDGGKSYDLSPSEEMVEGVNITDGYLGYIFTPENNFLSPYVFFKGNSKLESGPVVVVLAVPALKEKEYYK